MPIATLFLIGLVSISQFWLDNIVASDKTTPEITSNKFSVTVFSQGWKEQISFDKDIVPINISIKINSPNLPTAYKEGTKAAVRLISLSFIEKFIGSEQMSKNQHLIQKKIFKQTSHFILSQKLIQKVFLPEEQAYLLEFAISVSSHNLRNLLKKSGALYSLNTNISVLPSISFVNRKNGEQINWWVKTQKNMIKNTAQNKSHVQSTMKNLYKIFYEKMIDAFFQNEIYSFNPIKFDFNSFLSQQNILQYDIKFLNTFFNPSFIFEGEVGYLEDEVFKKLKLDLSFKFLKKDRVVTLYTKRHTFDTDDRKLTANLSQLIFDTFNNTLTQFTKSRESGLLQAEVITMVVEGPLSYLKLKKFEKLLQSRLKKVLRVHLKRFSQNKYHFKIFSLLTPAKLAKKINKIDFPRYQIFNLKVSGNKIISFSIKERR